MKRPSLVLGGAAAAFAVSLASPALATARQGLGGGDALGVSLARIVAALAVCLIVAVLAILLLRQRSGKTDLARFFAPMTSARRSIEVVETRRLSPHADICVVRHNRQEYLLLLLAGAATILSQTAVADDGNEVGEPCA